MVPCHRCHRNPPYKSMPAVHFCFKAERSVRMTGNQLCRSCHLYVKDHIGQFAPRPGFSKPAAFIVAQTKTKTVAREAAITLCICFGNWLRACEIKESALHTKTRYNVSELKQIRVFEPPSELNQIRIIEPPPSHITASVPPPSPHVSATVPLLPSQVVPRFLHVMPEDQILMKYVPKNGYALCRNCNSRFALTASGNMRKHACT